jgi:hypothetical protein
MSLITADRLFGLPQDVLFHIVSYMEPEDILKNLEFISKVWRTNSLSIWKHFCGIRFGLECSHRVAEECRAKVISYCQCARILRNVIENPKHDPWYFCQLFTF